MHDSLGDMATMFDSRVKNDFKLSIGERIGDYVIEEALGRGGMGAVYRVKQVNLGSEFAMKVLLPEVSKNPMLKLRFEVEARVMAKLECKYIVKVHYFSEHEGMPYIVMDLIKSSRGKPYSLDEIVDERKKLPGDEVTILLSQLCKGLSYMHNYNNSGGIIHRDLKPANILLNANGQVLITDFGLVKVNDPELKKQVQSLELAQSTDLSMGDMHTVVDVEANSELTMEGSKLGTFDYMAPELRTDGAEATVQSDIYAVGIILYKMLTGRMPIGRFKDVSFYGCHSAWDDLVNSCLEWDPNDRPKTIDNLSELNDRVSRYFFSVGADQTVSAVTEGPVDTSVSKKGLINKGVLMKTLLVMVVLTFGTGSSLFYLNKKKQEEAIILAEKKNLERKQKLVKEQEEKAKRRELVEYTRRKLKEEQERKELLLYEANQQIEKQAKSLRLKQKKAEEERLVAERLEEEKRIEGERLVMLTDIANLVSSINEKKENLSLVSEEIKKVENLLQECEDDLESRHIKLEEQVEARLKQEWLQKESQFISKFGVIKIGDKISLNSRGVKFSGRFKGIFGGYIHLGFKKILAKDHQHIVRRSSKISLENYLESMKTSLRRQINNDLILVAKDSLKFKALIKFRSENRTRLKELNGQGPLLVSQIGNLLQKQSSIEKKLKVLEESSEDGLDPWAES